MITGAEMKFKRLVFRLTLEEMAERLDITASYLSLCERGKQKPSKRLAERFIKFLKETENVI